MMPVRRKRIHHLSSPRTGGPDSRLSSSNTHQLKYPDEIRFPLGIRAIDRITKGLLDWNLKMGLGCYIEGDHAFLFIADAKHAENHHLPPKKGRIILVRKKIGLCT